MEHLCCGALEGLGLRTRTQLHTPGPSAVHRGRLYTCCLDPGPLCALPALSPPDSLPDGRYVVLDGVQDPGNVGAVLRTADAFGCTGALLLPGCADPYSLKTLRASMGAVFRLPLYTVTLPQLSALLDGAGLPLYGTALRHDTVDVRSRDLRRCALVIGSEGQGARAETLALCRETLRIPMTPHCESLNAAAAAAVLLWEAYRAEEGN